MPKNIGTITSILLAFSAFTATLVDALPPKYGAILSSVSIAAMMLSRAIVNSAEAIADARKESGK